jgi:hypothetical protein
MIAVNFMSTEIKLALLDPGCGVENERLRFKAVC